ncbi:hypothetical protein PCE1_004980 [Barthelona sp. PCE]
MGPVEIDGVVHNPFEFHSPNIKKSIQKIMGFVNFDRLCNYVGTADFGVSALSPDFLKEIVSTITLSNTECSLELLSELLDLCMYALYRQDLTVPTDSDDIVQISKFELDDWKKFIWGSLRDSLMSQFFNAAGPAMENVHTNTLLAFLRFVNEFGDIQNQKVIFDQLTNCNRFLSDNSLATLLLRLGQVIFNQEKYNSVIHFFHHFILSHVCDKKDNRLIRAMLILAKEIALLNKFATDIPFISALEDLMFDGIEFDCVVILSLVAHIITLLPFEIYNRWSKMSLTSLFGDVFTRYSSSVSLIRRFTRAALHLAASEHILPMPTLEHGIGLIIGALHMEDIRFQVLEPVIRLLSAVFTDWRHFARPWSIFPSLSCFAVAIHARLKTCFLESTREYITLIRTCSICMHTMLTACWMECCGPFFFDSNVFRAVTQLCSNEHVNIDIAVEIVHMSLLIAGNLNMKNAIIEFMLKRYIEITQPTTMFKLCDALCVLLDLVIQPKHTHRASAPPFLRMCEKSVLLRRRKDMIDWEFFLFGRTGYVLPFKSVLVKERPIELVHAFRSDELTPFYEYLIQFGEKNPHRCLGYAILLLVKLRCNLDIVGHTSELEDNNIELPPIGEHMLPRSLITTQPVKIKKRFFIPAGSKNSQKPPTRL